MIGEALTDDEILATREVMLQLRTGVAPGAYLETVRSMMRRSLIRARPARPRNLPHRTHPRSNSSDVLTRLGRDRGQAHFS